MKRICALVFSFFLLVGSLVGQVTNWAPDTTAYHTDVLLWSYTALDKVFDITAGMRNEIGLCGFGHVSSDTAFVDDVQFPGNQYSSSGAVVMNVCPEGTFLLWHNHPYDAVADSAIGFNRPAELCQLSWSDVVTAQKMGAAWVSVATATSDTLWLCWWSKNQVDSAFHGPAKSLPRVKFQGLIGTRRLEPSI